MRSIVYLILKAMFSNNCLRNKINKLCKLAESISTKDRCTRLYRPNVIKNSSHFKELIAVSGCGHSGSGAVIDFLSEFCSCTVLGYHDLDGGTENAVSMNKNENQYEIDILRDADGLFQLEYIIESNNSRVKNIAIKRFMALCEYYYNKYGGVYNDDFISITENYLDEIIDYVLTKKCETLFSVKNSLIIGKDRESNIYHLKKMSVSEYRFLTKKYIREFLALIPSKDKLVLDQFVTDMENDLHRNRDYIDNLKVVLVFRDPRDVFATSVLFGEKCYWIPKNVEAFVKWYRSSTLEQLKKKDQDLLIIGFEEFITNYTIVKNRIINFLELRSEDHLHERMFFDPSLSVKNIGLYKKIGRENDILYIERELGDYCYSTQ